MTPIKTLEEAVANMQAIIDSHPIDDQQLVGPTPCRDFTVEQLGEHIIDTHNLLLAGAGGTATSVAGTLGQRHAEVAAAAVAQWSIRGTDGVIDLGGNEVPAAFGLNLHALESYIHGWDLAKGLDRPFEPSIELTTQLLDFARSFITDDLRGDIDGAPYGAVVSTEDPDPVARLIAHSGRDPHWALANI